MNKFLISLAIAVLLSAPSLAVDNCTAPTAPTLPASLTDQAQADIVKTQVLSYQDASVVFFQCLIDYANGQGANLSQVEKDDLRARYDANAAQQKTVAQQWNGIYGTFLGGN